MPKCIGCGMLATRDDNGQAIEVNDVSRRRGFHVNRRDPGTHHTPFCYANSPAFPADGHADLELAKRLAVEIVCEKSLPWHPGKSPKEHEEMDVLAKVQALHAQYRADDGTWRATTEARIDKRFAKSFWVSIAALALSVIALIWNGSKDKRQNQIQPVPTSTAQPSEQVGEPVPQKASMPARQPPTVIPPKTAP